MHRCPEPCVTLLTSNTVVSTLRTSLSNEQNPGSLQLVGGSLCKNRTIVQVDVHSPQPANHSLPTVVLNSYRQRTGGAIKAEGVCRWVLPGVRTCSPSGTRPMTPSVYLPDSRLVQLTGPSKA